MGCASTSVGANSSVLVIQCLSFGIIAVAVYQQDGPVSVGTPRPCRLRGGNEAGLGCQTSPPPHIPRWSQGSPAPPLYLIQQCPAHRPAAADVGVQRDLCGEKDAGGCIPTGATVWGFPPLHLPTQVRYSMALPTGTPPASLK